MANTTPDPQTLLAIGAPRPWRRRALLVAGTLLALVLIWGGWRWWQGSGEPEPQFVTQPAERGRLLVTVSATGNLQPTNQVDVGSEISGTVAVVRVQENDRVKRGDLLAQLDLAKLNDAVARSKAALQAAEAQVAQAAATVAEARANLQRLRHVAELSGGRVPSRTELDGAEAALLRAEATEASAAAAVRQAQAALQTDQTNILKATIVAPIDGVVLSRKIEPGQTVAASFQAPVLFTLAEDLAQMELQVDVDEADVSQVRAGQPAMFTVDAWPGRRYQAAITRVGFGSQSKDGVVTYKTMLSVNNDDLSLRPGMTANAEITTAERSEALLVPNAALRYRPPAQAGSGSRSVVGSLVPQMPRRERPQPNSRAPGKATVWVLREGAPVPVEIGVGLSDGSRTEVVDGALQVGDAVITESARPGR